MNITWCGCSCSRLSVPGRLRKAGADVTASAKIIPDTTCDVDRVRGFTSWQEKSGKLSPLVPVHLVSCTEGQCQAKL